METDNQDKQKKRKSKRARQELVEEGTSVEHQSQAAPSEPAEVEGVTVETKEAVVEKPSEPQVASEAAEGEEVRTDEIAETFASAQAQAEPEAAVESSVDAEIKEVLADGERHATEESLDGGGPGADAAVSANAEGEQSARTEGISNDQIIEALLFSSDSPLPASKIASVIGALSAREIRATIERLNENYQRWNCAFHIQEIAGGFQMLTRPEYANYLHQLYKVRSESKLSPASLETLAIIAYKQPVLRAEIEAIRGVACGEMIRSLMEKDLIKIVGRAEELGRPMLYGTTKRFMQVFGLASLDDLPKVPELLPPGRPAEPANAPEETKKPSEPQPSESAPSASSEDQGESKS